MDVIKASAEFANRYESTAPKKKYAVCLGYLGTNYQGLQINPDAITVECILEKALFLAGGMDEANFGNLQKLQWSRAARTDRGVHAVSQCCSMKLTIALDADPQVPTNRDEFIRRVNLFLPADIRVLAVTRVSKNFNAKLFCSKRRYQYSMPTYLLAPFAEINDSLAAAFDLQGPCKGIAHAGGFSEPNAVSYLGPEFLAKERERLRGYRAPAAQIDTLRAVLARYAGTNSFHNFTTGKTPKDTNARRFIVSFDCGPPEVDPSSGVEWVLLSVVGQSFLLNQIRKMVGYAVDVARGAVAPEVLGVALSSQKVDVPMAPGQGLYLDELYFEGYNLKMSKVNETTLQTLERRTREEADKKAKLKALASSSSSSSASSSDSSAASAAPSSSDGAGSGEGAPPAGAENDSEAEVPSAGGKEEDEEPIIHELLEWASSAAPALQAFKSATILPHVRHLEGADLPFLYFLDYLRVHRHSYEPRAFQYDDKAESKKRGRHEEDEEGEE